MEHINVRFPPELKARLEKYAEENHLTLSEAVRELAHAQLERGAERALALGELAALVAERLLSLEAEPPAQ